MPEVRIGLQPDGLGGLDERAQIGAGKCESAIGKNLITHMATEYLQMNNSLAIDP